MVNSAMIRPAAPARLLLQHRRRGRDRGLSPENRAKRKRPKVKLIGAVEFGSTQMGGKVELTFLFGRALSGGTACAEAG